MTPPKHSGRLTRLHAHLDADAVSKLRALSAKSGAPVALLIRRAIEAYLKKQRTD